MDAGQLLGRGVKFPPRVGADGRVAWSEGETSVRESIAVILKTAPRERIPLPEFGGGLDRFLFEPNTVTTRHLVQERITTALARWEPRIVVESVVVDAARIDPTAEDPTRSMIPDPHEVVATVTYRLVATQVRERVSLSVQLAS
jgi:phage baseplate assembly protein W